MVYELTTTYGQKRDIRPGAQADRRFAWRRRSHPRHPDTVVASAGFEGSLHKPDRAAGLHAGGSV